MSSEQQNVAGTTAAPTCYRHPGRETWIRCSRCERPICPDCMVDAAVGFQCPECVREGNRGAREARTVFGGRISTPGWVSRALIASCVVVFLLQQVPALDISSRFAMVAWFPPVADPEGVASGQWYRLVTAAFLHGGVLHLLLNMYALYLFGPALEDKLGRVRFGALYLLSAVGGSVASYLTGPVGSFGLGASGAIFGLFGAFAVVSRRLGRDAGQLYALIALNLVLGFVIQGIDWRAHLGGLVTGAAVAAVLVYAPRPRRAVVQAAGCAVLLAGLLALSGWRTGQITSAVDACEQNPHASERTVLVCVRAGGPGSSAAEAAGPAGASSIVPAPRPMR